MLLLIVCFVRIKWFFLSECKFELECFKQRLTIRQFITVLFIVVGVDLILSLLVIRSLRLLYLFLSILSLGVAAVIIFLSDYFIRAHTSAL